MASNNDGFMFFRNYYTATRMMTDDQRLQFYDAIIEYGILNEEPHLDGLMLSAFELVRPGIDKSIDIRERGRKGGIAKGENYKEKDNSYIANPKVLNSKSDSAKNEGKGREEKGREKEEEGIRKEEKKEKGRFTPPTIEDVTAYCFERGNNVDPQRFIDFYQSKGWKIGNASMKDWKAAVRTWEQRDAAPKKADNEAEIRKFYQQAKQLYPTETGRDEGWETFKKKSKGDPKIARRIANCIGEMADQYYSGTVGLNGLDKDIEVAYEHIRG